jgi:phosphoribosyl 1,2-cyclic phosphate phosphodiesterase
MISVGWGKCDPANPKNRRLRPSILVEQGSAVLLVDSSPDLREQLLAADVRRLDAVLYTHGHADHVHGIDDLREVNRAMRGPIDAYGTEDTLKDIASRFGYVFEPLDLETQPVFKPWLRPHAVEGRFQAAGLEIEALDQDHGYCRSTGFRIGTMAYCTDVVEFPVQTWERLTGLDLWIVDCMTDHPHPTHAHLDKVIAWASRLKPKRTVLTHMSPLLDYARLLDILPEGIEPGYDGMVLELPP